MTRSYFGTDGIRGRANQKITPELALKVGQATGLIFNRDGERRHRVVIGKDTRLSGYMIEYALVAGFTSVGMDVLLLGPMPTPAAPAPRMTTRCLDSGSRLARQPAMTPASATAAVPWMSSLNDGMRSM